MAKINKVYPSFYGGETEQADELSLDTQCARMVNCIPDVVLGTDRRNGTRYVASNISGLASKSFHTYDRGEGDEEYIFTTTDDPLNPLKIYTKQGVERAVSYKDDVASISEYMTGNLKGLTIQDRTFIVNKDKVVGITTRALEDTEVTKYEYGIKINQTLLNLAYTATTGNGDAEPIRYTYEFTGKLSLTLTVGTQVITKTSDNIVVSESKETRATYVTDATDIVKSLLALALVDVTGGFKKGDEGLVLDAPQDITLSLVKDVDVTTVGSLASFISAVSNVKELIVDEVAGNVAYYWLKRSSSDSNNPYNYAVYLNGVAYEYASDTSDAGASGLATAINGSTDFVAEAIGSVLKITSTLTTWTFDSWDSWGNQASSGWKGKITKLTDLPSNMPWDNVVVEIIGDDKNDFTDYFVVSEDGVWNETKDPDDTRGTFFDMPLRVDRLSDGTFEVGLIFWEASHIGSELTAPTPSFVGHKIQDMFFFKNRLGFASVDSIVMSESGGYYNFYPKTALNIIDTDPIDIAIASNTASKIYYAVPFQRSLFMFTKDNQFEVVYEGTFSPLSVSIDIVSNYDIDINVEPKTAGNSLYFISKASDASSQLREYIKDEDSLVTKGVDVTLHRPTLLPDIDKIVTSPALGYIIMYSKTNKRSLYMYKITSSGKERIQSAVFEWTFGTDIEDMFLFDKELFLTTEGALNSYLLRLPLKATQDIKIDEISADPLENMSYSSYITLTRWYPKIGSEMKTPIDNVQIKKVGIYGSGSFDVDVFRESYNTTLTRTFNSGSTADMSATIAGRTDDVVITIKNTNDSPFRISSVSLEGMYRQSSKEVR